MTKVVLLLLSSDQFSFPLIRYLVLEGKRYGWKTCIGSMFEESMPDRIKQYKLGRYLTYINITDFRQCDHAIRKADLIIGMVHDVMLSQIVDSCIEHGKSFISPSPLSSQILSKKSEAEENESFLLFECGFSPGLDHITSKKAIDNIHIRGGEISSFKTYTGSLVDESCIDNPWEFKLTESTHDIINRGRYNNRHLIDGNLQHIPHHRLFERSEPVKIKGMKDVVVIPEGDSLHYRSIYQLPEASTVIKGKIFRKGFEHIWDLIIKLGLTDNVSKIDMEENESYYSFLNSLLPHVPGSLEYRLRNYAGADQNDIKKLKWLGLFDEEWINGYKSLTPASVLQYLMERKFAMQPSDRDQVILQHQLEYAYKDIKYRVTATLVTQGENSLDSATAKAIGLTVGAAAKAILIGNINLKGGLYIPIQKEIYEPVLAELDDLGVAFQVEEEKIEDFEIKNPVTNQVVTI